MMTGLDLITDAMGELGLLAQDLGEGPSPAEQTKGLRALNNMLDAWGTQEITCFCNQTDIFLVTPNNTPVVGGAYQGLAAGQVYTVGPGGQIATTRPLAIDLFYTRDQSGQDHPAHPLTQPEFEAIPLKNYAGSWADRIFYDPQFGATGQGVLVLVPNPQLALQAFMVSQQQLSQVATPQTTVNLAPGYRRAVVKNLALEIAAAFGVDPSALLVKQAQDARADIERLNSRIHVKPLRSDYPRRVAGVKAWSILTNRPNR